MFAPKVTKAPAKANEGPTSKPAPQRAAFAARPFGGGAVERALMLRQTIGNQAAPRPLTQRARNLPYGHNEQEADPVSLTARGATQGLSRDFSKAPTFAPDFRKGGDRAADKKAAGPDKTAHEVPGDFRGALDSSASAESHERMVAWVQANQNGGEALAARFARPFGAWLGINLSPVRIHTDAFADQAAARLEANAFTVGNDVFFRHGKYAPQRPDGLVRLAHEIAHTAQQKNSGASAPAQIDALESQADEWVRYGRAARGAEVVGPTILREPTYPRRATGSAMIREVERVLTLTRDTASKDETTRMWSNVASNFGDVTAGSIARRVWTNLFLRHFVEPESRPGVESQFPRYMYSQSFGWIDAQHFFGFIDYAERHYQQTGDRQKAFDAATAQGVKIEEDQQKVRDYIVAGQSPDPGGFRIMQVRPPNTPLFRAPQAAYGAVAGLAANVVAGVTLSGTEGELFGMLSKDQKVKFWTDSAKSAFTYEDIPSDQLGTRFFFQYGIVINARPPAEREIAFRSALQSFFSENAIVDDQAEVDRQAKRWGLPPVERFLTSRPSEADVRAKYPSLFTLPPNQ